MNRELYEERFTSTYGPSICCQMNKGQWVECNEFNCCKTPCHNRQISNGDPTQSYEKCKESGKGYGLRSTHFIPANTLIGEYWGDVIGNAECEKRKDLIFDCWIKTKKLDINIIDHTAVDTYFVDPVDENMYMRYINHSCNPNCRFEKWYVDDYPRICVFSIVDLANNIYIPYYGFSTVI